MMGAQAGFRKPDPLPLFIEQFPQKGNIQFDCSFGTEFLAAVTADAAFVLILRRRLLVAGMPVHGFGIDWAGSHAGSAAGALFGDDERFGNQGVPEQVAALAARIGLDRLPFDVEFPIDKTLERIAQQFDLLLFPGPLSDLRSQCYGGYEFRVDGDHAADRRVQCDGIG